MKLKSLRKLKIVYKVIKRVVKTTLIIPILALAVYASLGQEDAIPPSITVDRVELPVINKEPKRDVIPRETIRREETIQEYAQRRVTENWGENHWQSFNNLVKNESGWNCHAKNKRSTAYGLGQFLDSTWKGTGISKTSDPKIQIEAMIVYVKNRYSNPINAWNYWKVYRYY